MDYCEWLKNATFVRCIGPDCGWGESLSAFGSSVITHHPLTPIQREKCGHDPQRDPFVYAGLPMVTLAGPADLVVAHPTAAVGVIRDGDRVEGRVIQTRADAYAFEWRPHCFTCTITLAGAHIRTKVTLADASTFLLDVTVTNTDAQPHEFAPWIYGRLREKLRGDLGFDTAGNTVAVNLAPAGCAPPDRFLRIRPSFAVTGYGVRQYGETPSTWCDPTSAPRAFWSYRPIGYEIRGQGETVAPGGSVSLQIAVGLSNSADEAQASLDCVDDPWDKAEARARAWYNDYFARMPDPPEELNEREKKHYYGSAFVIRHNEVRPTGKFQAAHWMHAKSFLGGGSDYVWFPDDLQFILLQLKDVRPDLAHDIVRDLFRRQGADGALTTMNRDGEVPWGHGPYLFAWNLLMLHDAAGDMDFLAEAWEPLVRFHRWMFDYWGDDGSGFISVRMPTQAGYDNHPAILNLAGPIPVADINACMVLDAHVLSRIATLLGKSDEASHWSKRALELGERVRDHFFYEPAGLFFNRYPGDGEFIQVKGLQCMFFPILAGLADDARARGTIERYLLNEEEFFTAAPFPDVARSEMYHNKGRHSGTTFLHWSLMGLVILARYGYKEAAEQARRRIITFVTRSRTFWMYWCPDGGGFDFMDMGGNHRAANVTWACCYKSIVRREYERFAHITNQLLGGA